MCVFSAIKKSTVTRLKTSFLFYFLLFRSIHNAYNIYTYIYIMCFHRSFIFRLFFSHSSIVVAVFLAHSFSWVCGGGGMCIGQKLGCTLPKSKQTHCVGFRKNKNESPMDSVVVGLVCCRLSIPFKMPTLHHRIRMAFYERFFYNQITICVHIIYNYVINFFRLAVRKSQTF